MSGKNSIQTAAKTPYASHLRLVVLLMFLGVFCRIVAMYFLRDSFERDDDGYRMIAEQLAQGRGFQRTVDGETYFPTAYRPPVYPLLLALISLGGRTNWVGIAAINLLAGGLCIWWASKFQTGTSKWGGIVGGVIVACDPLLLYAAPLAMTETVSAMLTASVLGLAIARSGGLLRSATLGCVAAIASLCRPVFLPWIVWIIAIEYLSPQNANDSWPKRIWSPLVLAVATTAALAPWVIRNTFVFGQPIVATTHGGYTLILGNNRWQYEHNRTEPINFAWNPKDFKAVWEQRSMEPKQQDAIVDVFAGGAIESRNPPEESHWSPKSAPDELEDDAFAKRLFWTSVRSDPWGFIRACFVRVWLLWNPLPQRLTEEESQSRTLARWAVGVWYAIVYLLAAWGAFVQFRADPKPALLVGGLLLILTLTHAVYWSNNRMRAPVIPALALLAGAGFSSSRRADAAPADNAPR